jgi:hypothetical protein
VFTTFEEHHGSIGRAVDGYSVGRYSVVLLPPTLSFSRPCGPLNTASVRIKYGLLRALAPSGKTTIKAETHGKYRKSLRPLPANDTYLTAPRRDLQVFPTGWTRNRRGNPSKHETEQPRCGVSRRGTCFIHHFEHYFREYFTLALRAAVSRRRNTAELSSFFTSAATLPHDTFVRSLLPPPHC